MNTVRNNLMTVKHYSPYCGGETCRHMPRTRFTGKQFHCDVCGWTSGFDEDFIKKYKEKWDIK